MYLRVYMKPMLELQIPSEAIPKFFQKSLLEIRDEALVYQLYVESKLCF